MSINKEESREFLGEFADLLDNYNLTLVCESWLGYDEGGWKVGNMTVGYKNGDGGYDYILDSVECRDVDGKYLRGLVK